MIENYVLNVISNKIVMTIVYNYYFMIDNDLILIENVLSCNVFMIIIIYKILLCIYVIHDVSIN